MVVAKHDKLAGGHHGIAAGWCAGRNARRDIVARNCGHALDQPLTASRRPAGLLAAPRMIVIWPLEHHDLANRQLGQACTSDQKPVTISERRQHARPGHGHDSHSPPQCGQQQAGSAQHGHGQ